MLEVGIVALILCAHVLVGKSATYSVTSMPSLPMNDVVQFYFLESSFPFNAPQKIK